MPAFINTNIASLNAQRNLNTSQSQLTTSLQRLSSGLRINSAKDDAAGLAIANRFTTQINGSDQASRNANDAISLAQTAEGALGEMTNNLQRIRELSVQAANSTNSDSDRQAIQQEVQQRLDEIDRTASTTNFNGQKILDGSFGSANFQIGANVGESISVNLGTNTSMRNSATGKIATATAGTLGATGATNGNVKATLSATPADLNFATQGTGDTAGQIVMHATGFDFHAASGQISGTSDGQTITGLGTAAGNFSTAGQAQVSASVSTAVVATPKTDYSAAIGQFDVTAGTNTAHVTLTGNYTNSAGVATEIQNQVRQTAGMENVSVGYDATSQKFTFTNSGKDGAANAVSVANSDANASDFGTMGAGANGSAAVPSTNLSMTIDGKTVKITGDYSAAGKTVTDVAAELTNTMHSTTGLGANYNASVVSGKLVITNTGSATGVKIANTDANAEAAGFVDSNGVAGSAAQSSQAAKMDIDGHTVNLNSNYGSYDGLAASIQSQLGTANYKVTADATTHNITVARTAVGASSAKIDVTNADTGAGTGFDSITGTSQTNGTAGAYSTAGGSADFFVDGKKITLNQDYSGAGGAAAMATAITGKLAAAGSAVTASVGTGADAGKIVFDSGSSAAVNITGADAKATKAGFGYQQGSAGSVSGSLALGDFQINGIQLGAASGPAKAYASTDDLAAAINTNVAGVYASVDKTTGALSLSSSADIKLAGAAATGATGFNATSAVADKGDLSKINVSTAAGALTAIQRTDSALTNVSSLRSTFGAMQNRFESVISNLASATENLSAARSRLQDTDFASETAKMTRGQILQQAGTAMLAQANSLPNGVLSLLRG